MAKPKLPIYEMSEGDFSRFKKKYLDKGGFLDKDAIDQIESLFGCGTKEVARCNCGEQYGHSYKCIRYYSPEAGIVDRLLSERSKFIDNIQRDYEEYKSLFKDIKRGLD